MIDEAGNRQTVVAVLDGVPAPAVEAELGHAVSLPFRQLDAVQLLQLRPDMIVCALFTAAYDATQVIARLETLGYTGAITVIAPPLPNPRMVERELRGLGPGSRLRLVGDG